MYKLLRFLITPALTGLPALLAVLLLAGCTVTLPPPPVARTEPGPTAGPTGNPVTIRIQLVGDASTFDPQQVQDFTTAGLVEQMFLGLTNIDNATGEVTPELAESWSTSDDGLTWTFNLRHDAVWSDGTPVTADNVVASIKHAVKPETAAPSAAALYLIQNAAAINQTEIPTATYDIDSLGVKALDDYTVEFKLVTPAPYFAAIASLDVLNPVPLWAVEQHGAAWTDAANIVVNGPYIIKEWVPGKHLIFEKNPTYYGAANAAIDRVEVVEIDDMDEALARYEGGDLDVISEVGVLPAKALARIRQDTKLNAELHEGLRTSTVYVGFTMTKPPFDNVLVRKAFSAAIDRAAIVRDVVGSGLPATQFAPKDVFGAPDPEVGIGYDPEQAKAWLAAAGYPDGAGFPPVTYRYFGNPQMQALAEALQSMWRDTLHVDVALEAAEFPAYFGTIAPSVPAAEMPGLWFLSWFADYPDENNWVYEVLHCTDSGNRPRAACTQADELAKAAGREPDPVKRVAMYRQVEQMMFGDEARIAPIYHRGFTILAKPHIQRAYPVFAQPNWDAWQVEKVGE